MDRRNCVSLSGVDFHAARPWEESPTLDALRTEGGPRRGTWLTVSDALLVTPLHKHLGQWEVGDFLSGSLVPRLWGPLAWERLGLRRLQSHVGGGLLLESPVGCRTLVTPFLVRRESGSCRR